jgi:hypothetical protein
VATDWSATREFLDAENALPVPYHLVPVADPVQYRGFADQLWAEPDLDAAAECLADLRASPERRARVGARARSDAARAFDPALYQARLRQLLLAPEAPARSTRLAPAARGTLVNT